MRKLVRTTLASQLASAGTLEVSYPAGTNPGTFTGGVGHKLVTAAGDVFKAPQHFTIAFGASTFTITWGASTLAAGTAVVIQLEAPGSKPQEHKVSAKPNPVRLADAGLYVVNLGAPDADDNNGIAESQSVTIATTPLAVLDGVYADPYAGAKAVLDVPRNVVAAWTGNAKLTVTGKDEYGNVMVETTPTSTTSHTGKKAFKEITSCSFDANVTAATIGTGDVLGLPMFLRDASVIVDQRQNGVSVAPAGRVFLPFSFTGTQLDTPTPMELVSPVAGRVAAARASVITAGTTGGAITFEVDTTAVDGLTLTVADGAAAGTRYHDVPSSPTHASTAIAIGSRIEVIPAAGFNSSGPIQGMVEIEAHRAMGTVLAGNASAAQSATSGDVRGTFAPLTDPDGSVSYELVVALPDPDFLGFDQYAG